MSRFLDVFGYEPEVTAEAPGRVNLLGEHTDYNEGFALPTVTPQRTRVELGRARGGATEIFSATFNELLVLDLAPTAGVARFAYGCLSLVRRRLGTVPPLAIHVSSSVPIGVGLSSSAALCVALLRALRARFELELSDLELALWAQRAEIEFVGVQCGVLDQMASSVGVPRHALFLDTRTLEHRPVPYPLGSAVVVIDSGTRRSLIDTAYNTRREECARAARLLGVDALRDVADLGAVASLPSPLAARARHVVTENQRVLDALTADAPTFGALMNASHASLRDDYVVSTPALDALAASLRAQPGTYGARLTGAGFGGACVALVAEGAEADVTAGALLAFAHSGYAGQSLIPTPGAPR